VLLEERNLLNEFLALGEAVAIDPCDNIRYNFNKITDGISSFDSNASSVFADYSRENIEGIMGLAGN
jgi:mannitol-1-phosphate/altronate dehydrogenase